ncbi:YicC family protein [Paraliomyxa miuraensis]|uniref:YicC family protein n=1 Tax=Paraliomyxa miuraensis TaxID=376150 RepID=UPI00224E1115|nr:DUF1732 domain-containing protein [Paraliomyxa miuraensis]MCX4244589.1 DUF1732 domain-containing protein [Paraliomyxa miuraensis]
MPLRSMTGYGTASRRWVASDGPWSLDVEARSVNARFLELKVRQPYGAAVEQKLRRQLEGRVGRGRVELAIHQRACNPEEVDLRDPLLALGVERGRVEQTIRAAAEVARLAHGLLHVVQPSALEILRVCQAPSRGPTPSVEAPPKAPAFLAEVVDEALDQLCTFRDREGDALAEAVGVLAAELHEQVERLEACLPSERDRLAERVTTRLQELAARLGTETVDPERVAQEIAVLVVRGDVAEELARVGSHLAQLRDTVGGPATAGQGKTLEFVAQELLREITTMGSKVTSHEGSRIIIESKGILERIREQVHNVE